MTEEKKTGLSSAVCLPGAYADENNRKARKSRHLQRTIKSLLPWRHRKYNTGVASIYTHTILNICHIVMEPKVEMAQPICIGLLISKLLIRLFAKF